MTEDNFKTLEKRLNTLELLIKSNSDFLENLAERIGQNFARQTFTIKQLSQRWQCSESEVRNLISDYKMRMLRTKNKKIRIPYAIFRGVVLEFENGSLPLAGKRRRATKPIMSSWEIKPDVKVNKTPICVKNAVRRLGEY